VAGSESQPESMVHLRTQGMETNQITRILRWGLAFVLAIASLNSPKALAQINGQEQGKGHAGSSGRQVAPSDSSTSDNANAGILQELERMRTRIQQLETQLKQQSADAKSTTTDLGDLPPSGSQQFLSASAGATQTVSAQRPVVESKPAKAEPFAFADWTWLNGTARTKTPAFDSKFFTPEIRADVDYIYDFNHPKDDTIGGSSEVFRSNEVHVTQLGVGGDFHYDNVR